MDIYRKTVTSAEAELNIYIPHWEHQVAGSSEKAWKGKFILFDILSCAEYRFFNFSAKCFSTNPHNFVLNGLLGCHLNRTRVQQKYILYDLFI